MVAHSLEEPQEPQEPQELEEKNPKKTLAASRVFQRRSSESL